MPETSYRAASPEGVAGAGVQYELLVGAILLTDLLLGDRAQGLNGSVVTVGFQRPDVSKFDDFFVQSSDGHLVAYEAKLHCDVGTQAFREIVRKAVSEWAARPAELSALRRHYGVVTTSHSRELERLARLARDHHGDIADFLAQVHGMAAGYQRCWSSVRGVVERTGTADADTMAFQVLRNLVVWHVGDSPLRDDERELLNRLKNAGEDPARALGALKALAGRFARTRAKVTQRKLKVLFVAEYGRRPAVRDRAHRRRRILIALLLCLAAVPSSRPVVGPPRRPVPIAYLAPIDRGNGVVEVRWDAEPGVAYTVFTRPAGAAPRVGRVLGHAGMATVYVEKSGGYCFKIWGTKLNERARESDAIPLRGADCSKVFPPGDKYWLDD